MLRSGVHSEWRAVWRLTTALASSACCSTAQSSSTTSTALCTAGRAFTSLSRASRRCCGCGRRHRSACAAVSASARWCHPTTATDASPASFLAALLEPEETVALEDATRTYSTMDVVGRCDVYDPRVPNVSAPEAPVMTEDGVSASTPLRLAHAEGRLWSHFAQPAASGGDVTRPPAWFEQLCRDLFFRTDSSTADRRVADTHDAVAQASAPTTAAAAAAAVTEATAQGRDGAASPSMQRASGDEVGVVDPYTWLPFDLLDVQDYRVGPFEFPAAATYTAEQRVRLCLGEPHKEYVHFCNTYAFPERWQIPTSVGTQPARLLVDPASPTPVVYLQLSPDVPPALWLPMKPTVSAIRGVLSSFAVQAYLHREEQHGVFVQRYETARRVMELQGLTTPTAGGEEGDVLRFMAYEARNTPYPDAPLREYPNQQEVFLGEYDDPERLLEHVDLCPLLFSIAHLRTVADVHAERMTPTIEGAGVAPSLYRCIFSKALIQLSVHLSAEVKLPPQDPEAFHQLWKDSEVVPKMKIPVFARVSWPDNRNLSGGGAVVRRFNRLFGTEFAADTPVDAVLSIFYVMQWAGRTHDLLGVTGMRQRVAELEAAARLPEPAKLYPGTREIPNPEYTASERLGMHIQYLSHLGDPQVLDTVRALLPTASAPVRMGCAKAALIAGDRELFRSIVASEPPGRMQHYMTTLVVKRKTRDLVDPEPRLLEDQYEFAAPLWTKRGTRIDRNTLEGAVDAARLLRR
ncbi:hypothetical protein NESM_000537700 [Novymonas esmeraldas]|uniref:Uncharacterized protein n=1 Tax=Novymonas esmeraldas TaxID=1808958 RepID=A0AAW0ESR1_9TRYP